MQTIRMIAKNNLLFIELIYKIFQTAKVGIFLQAKKTYKQTKLFTLSHEIAFGEPVGGLSKMCLSVISFECIHHYE